MENLNDIAPVVTISFVKYKIALIVVLLLLVVLTFVLYKYFSKKKAPLVSGDFFQKEPKQLLYDFTLFVKEHRDESLKDELEILLGKLEKYKYRKEEIPLEPGVLEAMREYIKKLEENASRK